jgi:multiple sugar transport system permease protein
MSVRASRWGAADLAGYAGLTLYLVFTIVPILWFLLASIQPPSAIQSPSPFTAFVPTWQNYVQVFRDLHLSRYIVNSLVICGASTVMALIPGVAAAYAFARRKTRGMTNLSFWILSNRMLPPIAVVIPLYLLVGAVGLLDTRLGMSIIYTAAALPYIVWTMISFFEDIPVELDEAAALDGCTKIGALWRVIVPVAMPGVLATGIFAFILSWSEFLFAVIFTSSDAETLPVAISSFVTDLGIQWGKMAAAGSVLILPLAVLFYAVQRYLIRGLSFGAVKG